MNQRITNQIHQLSSLGEISTQTLVADTALRISTAVAISSNARYFKIMSTIACTYRSDGVSGGVFPLAANEIIIMPLSDFKNTYILPSSAGSLYIQALGE